MPKDLHTRRLAADIVEAFECLLDKYNIIVPSPQDDEREEDNKAPLYGEVYFELLENVESVIIDHLKDCPDGINIVAWKF